MTSIPQLRALINLTEETNPNDLKRLALFFDKVYYTTPRISAIGHYLPDGKIEHVDPQSFTGKKGPVLVFLKIQLKA